MTDNEIDYKKIIDEMHERMEHAYKWSEISLWMSTILILLVMIGIIAAFVQKLMPS